MTQKDIKIWNSCPQDAFQISGEPTKPKVEKSKQMKPADRTPAFGLSKERWFRDAKSFGEWSEGIASFIQRRIQYNRIQMMNPDITSEQEKRPFDPGMDDPKFDRGFHPGYRR